MIKAENYITIQGWMRTELNLSGNDLLVYAIIYSYSQGDNSGFNGSLQYLADWCGATKQGISKNLKNLISKSLIAKTEPKKVGETPTYYTTKFNTPLNIVVYPIKHSLTENGKSIQHSLINNKEDIDNKDNNKEDRKGKARIVNLIYDMYLQECSNLPQPRVLTEKRKNIIFKAYKDYGIDDIKECFIKANNSDFLCGKNDRGWKADIEWLLGSKFINVLEGKYDNKKGYSTNNKPWERNVKSNKMSAKEKETELAESEKLEAMGIKTRF